MRFQCSGEVWPDAELSVLSGMELYGVKDNAPYQELFEQIERTPGASLVKPSGKIDLYRRLATRICSRSRPPFPKHFASRRWRQGCWATRSC